MKGKKINFFPVAKAVLAVFREFWDADSSSVLTYFFCST